MDDDGPSFGFGDAEPWLPQPEIFGELSVEAQTGVEDSTLELYRAALHIRREVFSHDEQFEFLATRSNVIAFRRGSGAICMTNYGKRSVRLPPGRVLLSSAPVTDMVPTDTTVWLAPD